jgi:hypothetical protein
MADGPFGNKERNRLRNQWGRLAPRSEFVVHLGNLVERDKDCKLLEEASDVLQDNSLIPVLVLPGDHDWYECDNQEKVWKQWKDLFVDYQDKWDNALQVVRHDERPENYAFVYKQVLFIGLHVISATVRDWPSWRALVHDTAVWLEQNFEAHVNNVQAVVLLAHAQPDQRRYDELYDTLVRLAASAATPILYLQGQEQEFGVDTTSIPNVMRVVLEAIGESQPVEVTIDPQSDSPFQFKRTSLVE